MNEESTEKALQIVGRQLNGMTVPQAASPVLRQVETTREIYAIAAAYSRSSMVPDAYRGQKDSPGHANCFVALSMGFEMGLSAMQALSHIYVVKGRAGLDGQLALALINKHAPIIGPVRYEEGGEGDKMYCAAWCIDKETNEKFRYTFSIADARRAGYFDGRHSDQWTKNPKLMLRYRSASYLIRTHYPGVLMWPTVEELRDIEQDEKTKEALSISQRLKAEEVQQPDMEYEEVTETLTDEEKQAIEQEESNAEA